MTVSRPASSAWRRLRGVLLRVARDRGAAGLLGAALALPAGLLLARDYGWETWLTDGLGLVLGATGLALLLMALGGARPDWIDPDPRS